MFEATTSGKQYKPICCGSTEFLHRIDGESYIFECSFAAVEVYGIWIMQDFYLSYKSLVLASTHIPTLCIFNDVNKKSLPGCLLLPELEVSIIFCCGLVL